MATAIRRSPDFKGHTLSQENIATDVKSIEPAAVTSTPFIPHPTNRFVQLDDLGRRSLMPPPGLPPPSSPQAKDLGSAISCTSLAPHAANIFVELDEIGRQILSPPPGLARPNSPKAESFESTAISDTSFTPPPVHQLIRFDKAGRRFLAPPICPPSEPQFARTSVPQKSATRSSGISLALNEEPKLAHILLCRVCTTSRRSHPNIEANHSPKRRVAEREVSKSSESIESQGPYYGLLWQAEEDLVYNTRIPVSTF
ncbi:hypothetical protein F5Y18DRAFT_310425 [Xylariaceae sp. FL1019]|nr:hypothetical protein F5Y18DRAFT_310425 [Xylariaceae sp. FL1019]